MNKKAGIDNELLDRVLRFYGNAVGLEERVRVDLGELARYARHYMYNEYRGKQKLIDALDGWKGY